MKKWIWILSLILMMGTFELNAQEKTVGKKGKTEQTQIKSEKPVKKEKVTTGDKIVKGKKGPEGQSVFEGPNGGQYYINKNGNKTYLKK